MNVEQRLAWRNLWRHPRRTWLTTGAMIFSNVLLVFLISLQFSMYQLMIANTLQTLTGHLQVQAEGYKDEQKMRLVVPDVIALADDIRNVLDLQDVAARGAAFALASSEQRSYGIQVIGVQPEFEARVSSIPGQVTEGRYLQDNDAAEIVIGSVLARNLRAGVGDEITLLGNGRDGSFAANVAIIVGIFSSGAVDLDRSIAEVPLGYFQDTFFMEGAGHQVVIRAPQLSMAGALQAQVAAWLPAETNLEVYDWMELQPGLKQAIQADLSSAFFMYGVLVILVAFSVLNTQLMSVLERTREFGIIMALGLRPGRLGKLVMLETAFMGFVGLAIGALIGYAVTLYFSYNGFSIPGMDQMAAQFNLPDRMYPNPGWLTTFSGPVVVFLFTLLSAAYPALRLHRLRPVEAMRAA
ncbi:MAG: FtsX-like permease family protein [Gammaproteobacteria bacterium]|nr:FtsX-like permease family protein [Gammaproteobacteria bacterium]